MKRSHKKISLAESEIRCLFEHLFGGPIPHGESLESAAQACAFYVGVEYISETLRKCTEEGKL